jgi:hypothetical protein
MGAAKKLFGTNGPQFSPMAPTIAATMPVNAAKDPATLPILHDSGPAVDGAVKPEDLDIELLAEPTLEPTESQAARIELTNVLEPAMTGMIQFQWSYKGPIGPDQRFEIYYCRLEEGAVDCDPRGGAGFYSTRENRSDTLLCPPAGSGEYSIQILLTQRVTARSESYAMTGVQSLPTQLTWQAGEQCKEAGEDDPGAGTETIPKPKPIDTPDQG